MTINGGMQDAVAGGKIALHSAFLNDLMEMPELSGDSIARTVDMALARIVVQNCNLNWFNLAEPCSTVTELIKCNHFNSSTNKLSVLLICPAVGPAVGTESARVDLPRFVGRMFGSVRQNVR